MRIHFVSYSVLPLLALLNTVDTILTYYFFQRYGLDIERNPLINALLDIDHTAILFLVLKLSGSILILYYWVKVKKNKSLGQYHGNYWCSCLSCLY